MPNVVENINETAADQLNREVNDLSVHVEFMKVGYTNFDADIIQLKIKKVQDLIKLAIKK